MASQKISTTNCFENRMDAAEFVKELLQHLKSISVLTMTIVPEISGAYCVHSVIDISLDDTEMQDYLKQQLNILKMGPAYKKYMSLNDVEKRGERNEL